MSPQTGWLLVNEIVPRLRASIPGAVRLVGSDDIEELVQDGCAIAAQLLHSAEARGKSVTPGNIAHYAVQHLKSGRRSTGSGRTDAMHPATQMCGRSRVQSMEEPFTYGESNEEPMVLSDAIACQNEDPSAEAGRRIDWSELEEKLDAVTKAILQAIAAGRDLQDLVARFRKSRSSIHYDKVRLAGLIKERFGPDVLEMVQARAAWRNNLDSNRERVACRLERQGI